MTFDLIWITHEKDGAGRDEYRAFAEFDGRAGSRIFASRDEMVTTLRRVLETQNQGHPALTELLEQIEAGSAQFSGANALDLTAEQARMLGWI